MRLPFYHKQKVLTLFDLDRIIRGLIRVSDYSNLVAVLYLYILMDSGCIEVVKYADHFQLGEFRLLRTCDWFTQGAILNYLRYNLLHQEKRYRSAQRYRANCLPFVVAIKFYLELWIFMVHINTVKNQIILTYFYYYF